MNWINPTTALFALAGLLVHTVEASANPLNAVASFTILADVVQQVGGDHVRVRSLVGPDGDPHQFEASPDDAKALKEADVTLSAVKGSNGGSQP